MKTIAVKIAGSEREPHDITIKPGTTASEILTQLNLQGYLLSTGPNSSHFFGDDEIVYSQVTDGDKLWATTPADVGSGSPGRGSPLPLLHQLLHKRPTLNMLKLKQGALLQKLRALKKRIIIRRSPKTYLKQHGWSHTALPTGSEWHGWYRSRWGSVKGRVTGSNPPRYYLYKPPEQIKRHSHWCCFSDQGNGWYSVHFRKPPKDIDSGVMAVERIISESMKLSK